MKLFVALLALLLAGCVSAGPARESLDAIARDWSLLLQVAPADAVKYNYSSLSLNDSYKGVTLPSLMAQLSQLELQRPADEPGRAAQSEAVERALARLVDMPALFERYRLMDAGENARPIASAFQQDLLLPRWRATSFFYIDCNAAEPFC